ncbi:hypothetical protein ACTNE3_11730, partial [Bacillota bacterium HCP3S3_F1_1]
KVISGGDNPYDIHDAKLSSSATAHESSSVTAHEISNTLGNKSPYEMFAFMYGEEILKKLGLKLIPPDKINLSPELLK